MGTDAGSGRGFRETKKSPRILIVDDDTDSALLVESVFAHLGCPTLCAHTAIDAEKDICTLKADLIILDWRIDDQTDARSITEHCEKILAKYGAHRNGRKKMQIVTYSSLGAEEISYLRSEHFEHVDHWQKPIDPADLLKRSLGVLEKIAS